MANIWTIGLFSLAFVLFITKSSGGETFKAAVYAHAVIRPSNIHHVIRRDEAVNNMKQNIEIYEQQTKQAKQEGAKIIVFPEDGLYDFELNRTTIAPYLEIIPDPKKETWSPCEDHKKYNNTDIQILLSCIAKNNSLYLVANMGDKQPCCNVTDSKCPPDGWYQYNTNVAFAPNGTLLARYHKYKLFSNENTTFNKPNLEVVYFDTPFGRFGLMVCFDVLFYEPAVAMVLQHNISNIAFTTAWRDSLPILSAIGFHSSFARALGVNFLSANLHLPGLRFQGSGIYTAEGAKTFYYGARNDSSPKLLVAELDVLKIPKPNINTTNISSDILEFDRRDHFTHSHHAHDYNGWADIYSPHHNHEALMELSDMLFMILPGDNTFEALTKSIGSITVSHKNEVKCNLNYSFIEGPKNDLFALIAFKEIRRGFRVEGCTLVKCGDKSNKTFCNDITKESSTNFTKIEMRAELPTRYVYPQVILSDREGELGLADDHTWGFHVDTLKTSPSFNATLLSATLIGRDYPRDT